MVAQGGVGGAQPPRLAREAVHLGRQLVRDDLVRGAARRGVPVAAPVGGGRREAPEQAEQFVRARRIGEQAVDVAQRVVARRTGHRPGGGQSFVRAEDLLDDGPAPGGRVGEVLQIRAGVGEAVGMVDAQPVEDALAKQLDDLLVRGVEHLPVLHAHPDQVRNGEETPVVELGAGQAPPAEPVPLRVEQLGKGQRLRALAQRERVLVVAQHTPVHLQTVQLVAQPVAEHGQQDPPALRLPVDVEPVRVGGVRPVPQYLLEGPVEPGRRRHVVGHDVGDQAEPVLPRRPRERPQPGLTTQLVPHARVVHDVVPVRGTGYGLQDRRQMQVRDTQRGQIRDGSGGRGERERRLELHPVRGRGRGGDPALLMVRCHARHANLRTRPGVFRVIAACVCHRRRR